MAVPPPFPAPDKPALRRWLRAARDAFVASGPAAIEPPAPFLALLRPELVQTVKWAGEPPEDQQPALTPRSSFAEWVAESRGTAEAWTDIQLEYAEKLRQNLLKFIKTA